MDLSLPIVHFALDRMPSEELRDLAVEMLTAGHDSPSLRLAAGETHPEMAVVGPLMQRAFGELSIHVPSRSEALTLLLRHYCDQIVSGAISADEGAHLIWRDSYYAMDCPKRLVCFVGLAGEFDDSYDWGHLEPQRCAEARSEWQRQIIEEARKILDETRHVSENAA